MGCCSSSQEPYEPTDGEAGPPGMPPKQQQFADGENPRGKVLPFVRYDTSKVPREIFHGEEVLLKFAFSEGGVMLNCGGGESLFVIERVEGWAKIVSGDQVRLKCVATGDYVQSMDDSVALDFGGRDDRSQVQNFQIFKQGRPINIAHGNIVFLQTWCSNYVELAEDSTQRAYRWKRTEATSLQVSKQKVVDETSTEAARKMQFAAFDLDGSGTISRAEMEWMLGQLGQDRPGLVDKIMGQCDLENSGEISLEDFSLWADGGGLSEEHLQHAEVLGNVAQRCSDVLHEEACLIQVLATASPLAVQQMKAVYEEKFGDNLSEAIQTKASEQDGWIFSNYWKIAVRGLLETEVELWTRALNDSMRGMGTDEATLTTLVCTFPDRLRLPIFRGYKEKYGRGLLEHITSETSFNYKKVLEFQAMAPGDCRAKILNNAMVGLGTSEDQLIRIIALADFGERREVKERYQRMFQKDLTEAVKSETSGDFQKALLCLLEAEEAAFSLEEDVEAIKVAMDGFGTDEAALIRLICSKTQHQLRVICKTYEETYGKNLADRVKSETSGHFQETMLMCMRSHDEALAHAVRDCMKGWGTDDTGLITLLCHLPDFKKESLKSTYNRLFNRDIIDDIKSDTSGDYEFALCALVRPAPEVWAMALRTAMKGLGTSDELLINTLVISKDEMGAVREAFKEQNGGQTLTSWIEGECSGDYKNLLVALCQRNSEDDLPLLPIYWAQRCRDALMDIDTLKDVLVQMPSVALKRGTEIFTQVYGRSLVEDIQAKCNEKSSFFSFSNYWKKTMVSLLDMPVERYVKGLNDAMQGLGTDEYTLTGLICTMPSNMHANIAAMYKERYGKSLYDHIESETSFNYKKVLLYQTMSFAESRAATLHAAMAGIGTTEDQLIRVLVLSTMAERRLIADVYQAKYQQGLIAAIESETSGNFQTILRAILESTEPQANPDFEGDCNKLKEAMEGAGTDEDALIRAIAGKTPGQIDVLKTTFQELHGRDLVEWVDDETFDFGAGVFTAANFRATILGLLRPPLDQLAYSVRDCIVGLGTDDTGLITCLVHLSERKRRELVRKYQEIKNGGDLYAHIKGDTSGNYKRALLALVKPPPVVWAEALASAMKGIGTSDDLLINWVLIAKDRMDEVREAFFNQQGKELKKWIEGECSGDYKDTLVRCASRKCYKFMGSEVGLTITPPRSRGEAIVRFSKTFNRCCKKKRQNPDVNLIPTEVEQQEMGCAFLYFSGLSSCAPNLDRAAVWELTTACGPQFAPQDDGPDLDATFIEWDYTGSGEISWNDFVQEMTTRMNDPGHYEGDPLPEMYN